MRTDTGRAARAARSLAAGCVLSLAAGTGCTGAVDGARGPDGRVREGAETGPPPLTRGDLAAVEREDLEAVFADAGVEGTFVLHDVMEREATVVEPELARERAVPASTFDLVSTLVGLQTGAVGDVDEVVSHGGGSQPVDRRERGMALREALPASNVPVYREVARRVGHGPMAAWVDRLDYGNRSVGDARALDRFWLEGPLEISAMEQTDFLARLARDELPVDDAHQEAVRELAALEEGDGYSLHAKAGWEAEAGSAPGWWVGWVESGEDLYTFALRVEPEGDQDAELSESLGREMLVELEVLPEEERTV
ncbi:penicillin-binding transpeptidase domain-containing protein [Nocardiopsis dassonvillei]|uniref:penicillin-binding transpeptidase domain-containing protein n=1 Tax=Nocardiopsis dassonvillei TaxID=2014 RepID=UPI0020100252|nr:penicillin-binding transpeptidase domain-containing protein [Nocardiopsis dassonvillei]MCK9873180.1 penicillin-binding transpeptidase domain-containing protein [Nocardiopsis dassonvillei]